MAQMYLRKTKEVVGGKPVVRYDFSSDPTDIAAHTPFMAAVGVPGAVRLSGIRRSVRVPEDMEETAEHEMERALGLRLIERTEPPGKPKIAYAFIR